ncbi:hypothetical protein VDGL01_10207 [Verticillium dahliae]
MLRVYGWLRCRTERRWVENVAKTLPSSAGLCRYQARRTGNGVRR